MNHPASTASGAPTSTSDSSWEAKHLLAFLIANVALALGAWLVRLADTGPVAAGFWRLALALPIILIFAAREPAAQRQMGIKALALILGAGIFFALDLASWHIGIVQTKLGNAALFGNSGSLLVMAWGLIAARRAPRLAEIAAIITAVIGTLLLMGESFEVSPKNFIGDLFCLLAGVFYAFYIVMLNSAREKLGQFSVLLVSMFASVPIMLVVALGLGEQIMPSNWTPLIALAFSSQIVGQGLLIYSLRHFPPLIIGLGLLTQPAISATVGWLAFDESLSSLDVLGMALVAAALVLAKLGDKGGKPSIKTSDASA